MKYFTLCLFFVLAACGLQGPHVTIKSDRHSKDVEIYGWGSSIDETPEETFRLWRLRSYINKKTHAVNHRLYVTVAYFGDTKYFNRAADETVKNLPVTGQHIRGENCSRERCEVDEYIEIALSDQDLRQHTNSRYTVELYAKNGDSLMITIAPEMTRQQLEAIDKYVSNNPASSAP